MSDISELSIALQKEDEVGRVIRIHLHIENLINQFLQLATPYPDFLSPLKLDYFGKVQLSLALGLPEKFKQPLNFIGKIRNNFAHKLNLKIDKNIVNSFFDTFDEQQKTDLIETSSLDTLSWVGEGRTWKSISPSARFMVMIFALYYGLKTSIVEFKADNDIRAYHEKTGRLGKPARRAQ